MVSNLIVVQLVGITLVLSRIIIASPLPQSEKTYADRQDKLYESGEERTGHKRFKNHNGDQPIGCNQPGHGPPPPPPPFPPPSMLPPYQPPDHGENPEDEEGEWGESSTPSGDYTSQHRREFTRPGDTYRNPDFEQNRRGGPENGPGDYNSQPRREFRRPEGVRRNGNSEQSRRGGGQGYRRNGPQAYGPPSGDRQNSPDYDDGSGCETSGPRRGPPFGRRGPPRGPPFGRRGPPRGPPPVNNGPYGGPPQDHEPPLRGSPPPPPRDWGYSESYPDEPEEDNYTTVSY